MRDKDGKFYIGIREAQIKENSINVGDKDYAGTPGLWELIVAKSPDDKIFTIADYDNYAEIMHSTNALRRNNDESETKSKANKAGNGSTYYNQFGMKRICIQETVYHPQFSSSFYHVTLLRSYKDYIY